MTTGHQTPQARETSAAAGKSDTAAAENATTTSENRVATSKSAAATSESETAASESRAATSESEAATSESEAATSESRAATSESEAATSESGAGGGDLFGDLVRERRGSVLMLRLNRPGARNALTPALMAGLGAALLAAEADPEVRSIVLTGAGDRAFCSGMDLRAFSGGEHMGGTDEQTAAYHRLVRGETALPVIGAANGTAIGGGLELLLGCDVIVASREARFGFPEVRRGLFPAGGGTFVGTRIPLAIALEMVLTGDLVEAARAHELGLVNAVVPPGEVLAHALAYAERIGENAPLGLAAAKELVRLGVSDAARATARMAHWQSSVFTSDDAREGAIAFVEKRKPVWKGR